MSWWQIEPQPPRMSCTPFPDRQNTNPVFYVTNVILIPVLFGVGFMGNFVTSIICNHGSLRNDNAVFIHVCGLAVVDAIVLLCTVPQTLQEVEIFPANVTYSRFMAYSDMVCYIFGNIGHHAALWLMVILGFYKLNSARHPYDNSRISRNSTNRIIVFVSVLVCVLFNFPRFLEVSVREVMDHCFIGMSLWDFKVTAFGSQEMFTIVYPWAITALCHALPLLLMVLAALLLWRHAGWRKLRKTRVALRTTSDAEGRQLELIKAVWVVLLAGFCLELPNLAIRIWEHVWVIREEDKVILYSTKVVASYLCLLRASVNFIILIVYCGDFRKALRRTFCCICNCSDEFYEPCACCSPSYRRHLKQARAEEEERRRLKAEKAAEKKKKSSKSRSNRNRKPRMMANGGPVYESFDPEMTRSLYTNSPASVAYNVYSPAPSGMQDPFIQQRYENQEYADVETEESRTASSNHGNGHLAVNGLEVRDHAEMEHPWV